MDTMLGGPGGQDPRMYYYFYRQVDVVPGFGAAPNEEVLECGLQNPPTHYVTGGHVFCGLPAGYWGRDHGNDQGIPPDGFLRTLNGVYPAGGLIDGRLSGDAPGGAVNGDGQGGAGVTPILLASWVDFMQAEKALFADGDATAARAHLDNGMTKSTAKVTSFSSLNQLQLVLQRKSWCIAAYDDTTATWMTKRTLFLNNSGLLCMEMVLMPITHTEELDSQLRFNQTWSQTLGHTSVHCTILLIMLKQTTMQLKS